MKGPFERFLDKLNFYFWDLDSPFRRFCKRHRLWVAILFFPSLVLISLFSLVAIPIAFAFSKILSTVNLLRKLFIKERWGKTFSAIGVMILQILLFGILIGLGYLCVNILLLVLHNDSLLGRIPSIERGLSLFICIYGILLVFKMAAIKWSEKRDFSKFDWEEERDEMIRRSETPDKGKYHALFTAPEYLNIKLSILKSISPFAMICLLNLMLSMTIVISALVCHEAYFLTGKGWFLGVSNEGSFTVWVMFIFSLVLQIVPIDILNIFNIELTTIKPVAPYGTSLVFVINAAIAWLFISFFYTLIIRIMKDREIKKTKQ